MVEFLLAAVLAFQPIKAQRQTIHLEAEDGQLVGTSVTSARPGFLGKGYVTGFTKDGDKVILRFDAKAGIYDARIRYSTPMGAKGYGLKVNGSEISGMFGNTGGRFDTVSAGKVELRSGANVIEIEKGWGYFDVDYVELIPAKIQSAMKPVPIALADHHATAKTLDLFKRLASGYGHKTLSGQYDVAETEYIEKTAFRTPAIYGGDFMDYSPSRVALGSAPAGTTEKIIERARTGQMITLSWHWNAPTDLIDKMLKDSAGKDLDASWYKGFYTYATKFDLSKAIDDPNSANYKLLLRDIDAIAVQLKKLSGAGVPVLWRPLHEAEGGWFWWGAKGPKPFVKLWRLMFDRLTNFHHLHNLIWVFTTGSNMDWYPGDAFVDILGIDAYPPDHSDALTNVWEPLKRQFDGKKLLAISEFGGVPDIPRMHRFGVEWSYFVSWPGGIRPPATSVENLKRIYQDSGVKDK